MKEKRAFTLIEVMVVLSILAIIAILSYNFFGSVIKEAVDTSAATQINKEIMQISDAWHQYRLQNNNAWPGGSSTSTHAAIVSDLVGSGLLKAWPTPPTSAHNGGAAGYQYRINSSWTDFLDDGVGDVTIDMWDVTLDVCSEFNSRYTKLGAAPYNASSNPGFMPPDREIVYCFSAPNSFDYYIQHPVQYNE